MKKRKVSDATFFVTRRVGRLLGGRSVFRGGGRVGVGVSGDLVSSALLWVLHVRHRWVPVRTELVPLHLGEEPLPSGLRSLCERVGVACRVLPRPAATPVAEALLDAAASLGLDAVALGDVIDDRAARVLGSLVFEGVPASVPPLLEVPGRPILVRPFALIEEAAVLRVAMDEELDGAPPRQSRDREWLERLLAMVPGERLDLLTNLVNAPDRVRVDYLV
ncbi:MAG: hypothetical protein FJ098_04290 [Deltaproteobacteria bacterium]|nr:hypothetical protein [Deltaproteobacteria bacterium]